jgi:hypothetical protein
MKGFHMFAGLALASSATSALADVSARYETIEESAVFNMEMTIEASEDGHVRMQMGNLPAYYLLRGGELYSVQNGYEGPIVVRIEDQLQIQSEFSGRMFNGPLPEDVQLPDWQFAAMGEEVVNGRSGTAYGIVPDEGGEPVYALMVIGHQPELAPLGEAMRLANEGMIRSVPPFFSVFAAANDEMVALIGRGAPLRITGLALTDVSTEDIPPHRFELPAAPLTIEQLRSQLVPFPPPPTLPTGGE